MNSAPKPADDPAGEITDDAVLAGRLKLKQPRHGHRFGHDAILLAAATDARPGDHAVELGAGVGAAGLALAARVPDLSVTLVEIDPALVALAAENAERNQLGNRVRAVALDASGSPQDFEAAGLGAGTAARVLMNPPFNAPETHNVSPDAARRLAHSGTQTTLSSWLQTAVRLLRPGGVLTLIWRAEGLFDVLNALSISFGAVAIMPVHPRPDAPAIRVLVRAVKGSRGTLAILPRLILNDTSGKPTPEVEAVLRGGTQLSLTAD
jgi:tRNA1(Val) A37 N6-methylase TrmN6